MSLTYFSELNCYYDAPRTLTATLDDQI